jgi:NAD(P)-dependent dehydrogenase (short-subunit alcohol dehydrogenase family)
MAYHSAPGRWCVAKPEAGGTTEAMPEMNQKLQPQQVKCLHAGGSRGIGRAAAFQADIAQEGAAEKAIDAAVATLGPLTGVVVSAGIFEGASLEEMDLAFWNRTMEINLAGTFLTVKAAVPHLRELICDGKAVWC